jgi:mediator of RNA polymerase II transcription subunit 7
MIEAGFVGIHIEFTAKGCLYGEVGLQPIKSLHLRATFRVSTIVPSSLPSRSKFSHHSSTYASATVNMDPSLPAAPYPAPPPFYKAFTTTNLARLDDISNTTTDTDQKPLPVPLAYLKPPPPPTSSDPEATYPTFQILQPLHPHPTHPPPEILLYNPSTLHPTSPSLPASNPATLLLRLTKSLLLNFLELISIMSETPEAGTEKIEDVRRIMINVHGVLNGWRPHQGREEVRGMLEGVREEGRRECEGVERGVESVRGYMNEVLGWKERGGEVVVAGGDVEGREEGGMVVEGGANGHVNGSDGKERNGEMGGVSEERVREVRRLWSVIGEIGEE